MSQQVRGLGKAGLLPARANSSTRNHSQGPMLSTAGAPAPPARAQASPLPPAEPRADSVTSPPMVVSSALEAPSAGPRLPPIAERGAAADAAAVPAAGPAGPQPAAQATAAAAPAAAPALPADPTAVEASPAAAAAPAADASPSADQPPPSGRRKPRKTRPITDTASEPPAKRARGGDASGRRGRGRGRGSRGARPESAAGVRDDGADLVGLRVEVPGSVFHVHTPGLVYVCDVQKKDDRKRDAVEVVFRDDASVYWFPAADVRAWLAEQRARDAAGTVPLVAGVQAAAQGGEDSEETVVDEAGEGGKRGKEKKRGKKGTAGAGAGAHEDGSSLQQGGRLAAVEAMAARALTDISAGGSGSRGHAPVDSAAAEHAKASSRLRHAG